MSCDRIESMLALYIDDALTPEEVKQVEQHLQACLGCQALLQELRDNQAKLKALPPVAPPDRFREELLRRIATAGKRKQPVLRYLLPKLGSLAAALLVVLFCSNLYLFPAIWPAEQPPADVGGQVKIMMTPDALDETSPGDGEENGGEQKNASSDRQPPSGIDTTKEDEPLCGGAPEAMRFSAAAALDLGPEQETADRWLWSGVVAIGLFGMGTGFFVCRYRRL